MSPDLTLRIRFIQKTLLVVMFFSLTIQVQAQSTVGMEAAPPISPGPPMWQVTKGEHVLWIFGILTPLEAGVNWQSEQVESVIAQSREYIYFKPPEPKIPLNPFKLINGLRLVLKIRNNPDGKRLEEVIPADLYSRFSQLVDLYQIPDMEKTRPYFAADSLRGWAIMANKLTEDHGVDIKIENRVREYQSVKITAITLGFESIGYEFLKESADKLISGASLADEINCLEASVDSIENDITGIQARAKAWALGDIEALHENRNYQNALDTCSDFYINMDDARDRLEDSYQNWVQAVEEALENNKTTFAVLNIDQLINPDGVLGSLRKKGYTIIEP